MNPRRLTAALGLLLWGAMTAARVWAQVPLMSPSGLVFDASGGIYLSETNRHVVDRFDTATGVLTVVAGNGTQGFGGDGGPATSAELDSPQGLALDSAGNLYIADAHNHRVRRVVLASGIISTIAGSGVPGFSGDGGAATGARLSLPVAVAANGSGDLFIADSNNHRIRRVVLATGIISTYAGNGTEGDTGDGGPATGASVDQPGGLALDATGNLYVADTQNRRVRMVAAGTGVISAVAAGVGLPRGLSLDASGNLYAADVRGNRVLRVAPNGTVSTIAGTGAEGFAGDGGQATAALLDAPRSTGVSPAGLLTLADTRNQRVRQVDAAGIIRTLAGVGTNPGLTLSGPSVVQYGTGTLFASMSGGTGTVSFFDLTSGTPAPIGTATLNSGVAGFSTGELTAGMHRIFATYAASTQSAVVGVTVTAAPVTVAIPPATMVYGAPVPALTGTLTGVLPRDAASVSALFSTSATSLSPVGSYPVTAVLKGPAAANYQLAGVTGSLVIGQAGTITTLGSVSGTVTSGTPIALSAQVTSTTQGTPTGKISFLDGSASLASLAVDATGAAATSAVLGVGTHALTAVYAGDTNFFASGSAAISTIVTPATPADFGLSSTGSTSQTITAGTAASFGFAVAVTNGPLSGPILLTASGLPVGASASFSPANLSPGVSNFTMTIQTAKASAMPVRAAGLLLILLIPAFCRRRRAARLLLLAGAFLVAGCGDRKASVAGSGSAQVSYPITVTGTSTLGSGTVIQRTAVVTLTVQ